MINSPCSLTVISVILGVVPCEEIVVSTPLIHQLPFSPMYGVLPSRPGLPCGPGTPCGP